MINPKWAEHGFNTFGESNEEVYGIRDRSMKYQFAAGAKKILPKLAGKEEFKESRSAFSGLRIEELKKLIIPPDVMKEGLLFIWVEKELILEIIKHFET